MKLEPFGLVPLAIVGLSHVGSRLMRRGILTMSSFGSEHVFEMGSFGSRFSLLLPPGLVV